MRKFINIVEGVETLSDRIFDFLDRHAGISPNYDPDYDDPEERFTGPDASMLNAAAEALRDGQPIYYVHSDYGSGTYRPYGDIVAKAEHDGLVREVNLLVKR